MIIMKSIFSQLRHHRGYFCQINPLKTNDIRAILKFCFSNSFYFGAKIWNGENKAKNNGSHQRNWEWASTPQVMVKLYA